MQEISALNELVSQCSGSILYIPTKREVDHNDPSFPLQLPKESVIIPQDKHSDPFEWTEKCIAKFGSSPVCILIPGTRFDAYGTRHGKGAGWYDRFLSHIPANWIRIGVVDIANFSQEKLVRQAWDQPVHWVIVKDGTSWRVHKALP